MASSAAGDLRGRQIERLRDLVDGRLAAVLVGQLLSALQNAVGRVARDRLTRMGL